MTPQCYPVRAPGRRPGGRIIWQRNLESFLYYQTQTHTSLAISGATPVSLEPWPARGLIGIGENGEVDALFGEAIARDSTPG